MKISKIIVTGMMLMVIATPSIAEFKAKEIAILAGETLFSTKLEDQYKTSDTLDFHEQVTFGIEGVLGDSNSSTDLVVGINLATKSKTFSEDEIDVTGTLDTSFAKLGARTHLADWFFVGAGLNYTTIKGSFTVSEINVSSSKSAFGFYGEAGIEAKFDHMKIGTKYVYNNSEKVALFGSTTTKVNPTSSSILGFVSYVFYPFNNSPSEA
ncbi:MAG: hypothetical protein EXS67_01675 [Candidatus Margulisbacteria bacterium]|nr:hypothetical protein [Candidatus Margulisiibacteriota bacterium]